MIKHNTGVLKVCGNQKVSIENRLCSSEVIISYKAITTLSSFYKGFKLYYEFIDKSTQPNCPTNPVNATITTGVTTVTQTTSKSTTDNQIQDLVASQIEKKILCKDDKITLVVPPKFNLFAIAFYYGLSVDDSCGKVR